MTSSEQSDARRPEPGASVDPSSLSADPSSRPTTPSVEHLARIAEPATVRRAPRIGVFLTTGALAGIVLGAFLGAVAPGTLLQDRTPAMIMSAIGLGGLGAL